MGRFLKGAVCAAVLLPLAACGGGSGGSTTPPIALKGVSYERLVPLPALNQTQGGDGGDFRNVLYVEGEGAAFFGRQIAGTTNFQADDGTVAIVEALPGFESTRYIRIERRNNGVPTSATEGIIGRFTTEARMAEARGTAIYRGGLGTQDVRARTAGGVQLFDLSRGSTTVEVDFDARRVDVTLDFRGTGSGLIAPVDRVEIEGMTIAGNRFSGGALSSFKGSAPVAEFSSSGSNLSSSGIFAGWNDTTGAVAGGDRPAEVGGAFVANTGPNVLTGRYLAD